MLQDLLAIQIGLPADWWRGGTTGGDQGHQPIHIDIHAQSHCVVVQWKGETKVQHLHRPGDLPQTAGQETAVAMMSHSSCFAKGEGKGALPPLSGRGAVYTTHTHTCLSVCSRLLLLLRAALSGLTTAAATSRPIEGGKQVRTLAWLRPPDCDWSMSYLVETVWVRLKLTAGKKNIS